MKTSKKVILFAIGLLVVLISICIAGPFGFFGRGSGGCNIPTPDTTPDTPVVVTPVEKPDNILLHVPKTQSTPEVVKNEILTKPLCDCFSSKCTCDSKKTCTCISCNCEACPIKTKPVVKQEQKPTTGSTFDLPDPVDVKTDEVAQQTECTQSEQQYEYYERPRLFRRIFGRR